MNRLLKTSVAGWVFIASAALAQSPPGPTSQAMGGGAEDIVVTAQRRTQSLQEVPIAATVLAGDQLRRIGANDVRDVTAVVPNLTIDTPFGNASPKISLRGVGSGSFNQNTETTVAIYLDDLVLNPNSAKLGQLFDVERIEVLRGPQGTLYGKNSTGGAINIISRRPGREAELSGTATVARFGEYAFEAAGQMPLSDTVSARLAVKRRYRDGYGVNQANGDTIQANDEWAGRLGLRYENERADVYLKLFGDLSRADGFYARTIGVNFDGTPRPDLSNPITGFIPGPDVDKGFFNAQRSDIDNLGASLNASYDFGGATLTSVTGYLDSQSTIDQDCDGSAFQLCGLNPFDTDATQFSQELRLSSPGSGRFTWIIGASFFTQTLNLDNGYNFAELGIPRISVRIRERTQSYAAFADGTFELTGGLSVLAGVRITHDRKRFSHSAPFSLIGPYDYSDDKSWTEPTWRVGLAYEASPDANFYLSYNRGYRSGAYDTGFVTTPEQFAPVNPEYVDNFEAGAKLRLFDRRLQLNSAVFLTEFRDQQLLIVRPEPGSICCSLVNAGKSRIYGIEVEGLVRLTDNFDIDFHATATSAKYREFTSGGRDLSGERLSGVPTYQLRLAPEYRIGAPDGQVFINPEVMFTGDIRRSSNTDFLGRDIQKAYTVINGRLGYRSTSSPFEIFAFVKNATNKRYLTDWLDLSSFGFLQEYYSEPRSWGLTVSYSL